GLRRHVDQLRHLRLLPAGDDGPAARGPHPVRQTQARAARRGRRDRPPRRGVRPHAVRRPRGPMTEQAAQAPAPAPADGGGSLLEAAHISKIFGGLVAVNDISFTVPERAIVSLIGPNGAGKTTFFNCLTGLYKPTTGTVDFDGTDITAKRADIVTNAGIARTFQNIKLF